MILLLCMLIYQKKHKPLSLSEINPIEKLETCKKRKITPTLEKSLNIPIFTKEHFEFYFYVKANF